MFMNTGNSKINETHRFKLNLADLKNPNKSIALVNLSIWKNIKIVYNNNLK